MTAPTAVGAAIFAITLAAALLVQYGERRFRENETLDWQVAGWTAVLGGSRRGAPDLAADGSSLLPGSSGYASCFIAWAAMNIAVVLGGTYWLETILAREIRLRRAIAQDGGAPDSTLPVARLFRANLNGCTYFWGFIAARVACSFGYCST